MRFFLLFVYVDVEIRQSPIRWGALRLLMFGYKETYISVTKLKIVDGTLYIKDDLKKSLAK